MARSRSPPHRPFTPSRTSPVVVDLFTTPEQDRNLDNVVAIPSPPSPSASTNLPPHLASLQGNFLDHVSIPRLSQEQREKYTMFRPEVPVEIVRDYQEGGRTFYWARTGTGFVQYSQSFYMRDLERWGYIIKDYNRAKARGRKPNVPRHLAQHHPDLLRLVDRETSLSSRGRNASITSVSSDGDDFGGSQSPNDEEVDSQDEGSDENDDGVHSDDSFDGGVGRRVTRKSTKRLQKFGNRSPLKRFVPTRAARSSTRQINRNYTTGETSDTGSYEDGSRDAYEEIDELESSSDGDFGGWDEPSNRNGKSKEKKLRRRRPLQPAYGFVRPMEDVYAEDPIADPTHYHRALCERCQKPPAAELLIKAAKRKGRAKGKKKRARPNADIEGPSEDEATVISKLGGWVRCLKCCVASHWKCLTQATRDDILRAIRDKEAALIEDGGIDWSRRKGLDDHETTDYICGACVAGGVCIGCEVYIESKDPSIPFDKTDPPDVQPTIPNGRDKQVAPLSSSTRAPSIAVLSEVVSSPRGDDVADDTVDQDEAGILFRCITCKRPSHYNHLPQLPNYEAETIDQIARSYHDSWQCPDCRRWEYPLDKIIGWRPYPPDAREPPRDLDKPFNIRLPLPREYLVKWQKRSYRQVEWVPHGWLVSTSAAKLKNFCTGSKAFLGLWSREHEAVRAALKTHEATDEGDAMDIESELVKGSVESDGLPGTRSPPPLEVPGAVVDSNEHGEPEPDPNLEHRIPRPWKTVHRVLDVMFWKPSSKKQVAINFQGKPVRKPVDVERASLVSGEEPNPNRVENRWEREARTKREISGSDVKDAVWCLIKWGELGYEEATWDSPPEPGTDGYQEFKSAFDKFIEAQLVHVPQKSRAEYAAFDDRPKLTRPLMSQPEFGQNGKLLPFQLEGLTWLMQCWHNFQASILADEMGLGKTVQIVTFLGCLVLEEKCFPHLVIVPNSTIANWIYEFERWVPGVRAVPFFGEKDSRQVIKDYELYHRNEAGKPTKALKFHVLVTTYDTITSKQEFGAVFNSVKRWETLIVDEGQRLKSDGSLLFRKLGELNSIHRILMTGTPLNNNIRELFALMNFLDAENWSDLDALEKEHEELDDVKLVQLHERLKPYFLRRIKADVMKNLPAKVEVIVPISMAPIQKEVYKGILLRDKTLLNSLGQNADGGKGAMKSLNNMLMQLRKCMQHPYLIDQDLEDQTQSPAGIHQQFIDASGKLKLLKLMLPKLKERGHRVLLFSQFVIALDIIEDFVVGEGYKFSRLDGNTKQSQRQKDMEEFNREGSEQFIYLLSTRAGGVGINLWSADTVIIFDPDFNPHQDLQAIARAHRMGQKKKVLVFKFMTKGAAEEKIIQSGKKKLVLDHLIVQKMDDKNGESEDVQSILSFGIRALFDEDSASTDITYSDQDVDKLIDKIEQEEPVVEEGANQTGAGLGFAKIWQADTDALTEVNDGPDEVIPGYWAQRIAQANAEYSARIEQEASGRGVRRKATTKRQSYQIDLEPSPEKPKPSKGKGKTREESDSEDWVNTNQASVHSEASSDNEIMLDPDDRELQQKAIVTMQIDVKEPVLRPKPKPVKTPIQIVAPIPGPSSIPRSESPTDTCGICHNQHAPSKCPKTSSIRTLQDTRRKLELVLAEPLDSDDEMITREAISALDAKILGLQEKLKLRAARKKAKAAQSLPIERPLEKTAPGAEIHASLASLPAPQNGHIPSGARVASESRPKRQAEEQAASPRKKPKKVVGICLLCQQSPLHEMKECPVVLRGSKSIYAKYMELSSLLDIQDQASLDALYTLYERAHRREQRHALQMNANGNGILR